MKSPAIAGVITGAAMAVVIGVMAQINVDYGAPWASTHLLHVRVSGADAMSGGSDVRIAGRSAGQVVGTEAHGTYTDITVKVDSDEWPLPADTSASVRLATLLGAKYVELQPGTSHGTLPEGGVIPVRATQPVVDFDQVLDTFDTPTRNSLTALIRTLGTPQSGALAGQQDVVQQLIPNLADLSEASVTPTTELAARDAQVGNILNNLAITSTTLSQSADDLAGTIDGLNSVTGALATHTQVLEGFIANTNQLNRTTNAVLGSGGAEQLNAGLRQVQPFSANLNQLLTVLEPQTASFQSTSLQASIDLIYEIGDATSQSDKSGYFLRQNAKGVDLSGLLPIPSSPPSGGNAAAIPVLPQLPALPVVPTLPSLPALPPIPVECLTGPSAELVTCVAATVCKTVPVTQLAQCVQQAICASQPQAQQSTCVAQIAPLLQTTAPTSDPLCVATVCLGDSWADPQNWVAAYVLTARWEGSS